MKLYFPCLLFLENKGKDYKGRTLEDIWSFSDKEIERIHDFIQVIFPLDEPSRYNANRYYIKDIDLIEAIKLSDLAQKNLQKSSQWFLGFLERNKQWQKRYDHNQLRITRVIKSLHLLCSQKIAMNFYQKMVTLIKDDHCIPVSTYEYWVEALKKTK